MARGGGGPEPFGALILRVTLGAVFAAHAYRLLVLWGPTEILSFQKTYGLPSPALTYWYVVLVTGVGGLLLVLGILVRTAALANVPVAAAGLAINAQQGFFMDRDGGWELALVLLMASLAQACLGAGAFTLRR
jgi:putative oxidoreductase